MASLHSRRLLFQRPDQALLLKGLRTKLEDQCPQLGQAQLSEPHYVVHQPARPLGCGRDQLVGHRGVQLDGEGRLGDGVVQLPRQLLSLVQGGLAARLLVQPGVFHGRGRRLNAR